MANGALIQHIMLHDPQPNVPMVASNLISEYGSNFNTYIRQESANYANVYIETDATRLIANTNCQNMFSYLPNLRTVNTYGFDFSNTTNMQDMFCACGNLQSVFAINSWNVAKVKDFSGMFQFCGNFNGDLSEWDVSNANSLNAMFSGCPNFHCDLSNWNMSNVKHTDSMFASGAFPTSFNMTFSDCTMSSMFFNTTPSISTGNWNLSNCFCQNIFGVATYGGSMDYVELYNSNFSDNSYLTVNVSNLRLVDCTFNNNAKFYAYSLNAINLKNVAVDNSSFGLTPYRIMQIDTFDVDGLSMQNTSFRLFRGMSNLHYANIYNINANNTSFTYAFYNCNNLSIIDTSTWNTSNILSTDSMFRQCTNLTDINLLGINAINCNSLDYMFSGCNNLQSLDFTGWNTSGVNNMYMMFSGCNNLRKMWIPYNFVAAPNTNEWEAHNPFWGYDLPRVCEIYTEGNSEHHQFYVGSRNWNFHYSSTYQDYLQA